MSVNHSWTWHKLREDLRRTITGAQALAFFPAGVLAAYWVSGEPSLIGAAVLMPILFLAVGGFSQREFNVALLQRSSKILLQRDIFTEFVERT